MQITEHVHALRIPFKISIGPMALDRFVYSFVIAGKDVCLIDSGVAGSEKMIFDYLQRIGRQPAEISMVVQTHSHPDHIGATRAIKEVTDCLVAIHPSEKDWIEDVDLQSRQRPVPGFKSLVGGSVKTDIELRDGDTLDLGGLQLRAIHTPGHSKGSISLLLKEEGVLFSGDAIPVAGNIPIYEDAPASARSVKRLSSISGIKALLASWDQPRKGEEAYGVMNKGLSYLQNVHDIVLEIAVKEPGLDVMEICKRTFQKLGITGMAPNPLFARTIQAHLAHQHRKNLIQPDARTRASGVDDNAEEKV